MKWNDPVWLSSLSVLLIVLLVTLLPVPTVPSSEYHVSVVKSLPEPDYTVICDTQECTHHATSIAEVLAVLPILADIEDEIRPIRNSDREIASAIYSVSLRTGVDWRDLAILAWNESRWNTNAINPDGCACGAWQVRSSVCIEGRPDCELLLTPSYGARMAANELLACSGNIACYAAGPNGSHRMGAQRYARRHAFYKRHI